MVVHGYTSLATGPPRGLEGPRANTKSRAYYIDCVRGFLGACPQKKFEILHSLKSGLGASYFFCGGGGYEYTSFFAI